MGFLAIVIIGALIFSLINNNSNLKRENERLHNIIINRVNFCPNCGFDLVNYEKNKNNTRLDSDYLVNSYSNNNINYNVCQEEKLVKKKNTYTDKEIKNNLILIVGSVLIILSAVVFLTSTWNFTHDLVKTVVLFLMLLVFFAASYIADKYLNLKQTSKTFYYIALAYIPIILLSIAMFSLFGKYFSLYGLGRYIYLAVCSLIVFLIYYRDAKCKNNKIMFSFSVVFQILAVIFLFMIFSDNKTSVLLGVNIYNFIINFLYLNNKMFFDKDVHKRLCVILSVSMVVVVLFNNLFNIMYDCVLWMDILLYIGFYINLYILVVKIYNGKDIYDYCYPILIILFMFNVCFMFDRFIVRELLIIIGMFVVYLYNFINDKKINLGSYIVVLLTMAILFLIGCFYEIFGDVVVPNYLLFLLITFLGGINYLYDFENRKFSAYMFTGEIVAFIFSFIFYFGIPDIFISYFILLMIVSSMFVSILDVNLKEAFKFIGIISFAFLTLVIEVNNLILIVILYLIYSLVCFLYSCLNKDNLYKIISYVYFNIFMVSLFEYLNIRDFTMIIPFTTLVFVLLEIILPKIRTSVSDIYILIQFILSMVVLNFDFSIYGFVVYIIISVVYLFYIDIYKKNNNLMYFPLVMFIPYVYFSDLFIINDFNMMYYFSLIILGIFMSLMYYKKDNMYIIMFYSYVLFHLVIMEESKYIGIILLIVGSFICYLIKNNKIKDIFKTILYVFVLVLYNYVINDLGFASISMLYYGIYIGFVLLVTRGILKKYNTDYKILEYLGVGFINLLALCSYSSEFDGIIYVMFLTFVVIVAYIYKYGPVFLVCLVSILINVLLLTRTFWLSIPWWFYILFVGSVLVGFSIFNEVNDKKEETKNRVNDLKNHLDL